MRPSVLLGVSEPFVAFLVDDALAIRLGIAESQAKKQGANPSHGQIPTGFVYETPDMVQ